MSTKLSTFFSGIVAVGVYLFVIGLLLFYFNSHHTEKSIHYVKKNEDRIRVTMSAPKNKEKEKKKEPVKKNEPIKKKEPFIKKPLPQKNVVEKTQSKKKEVVEKKDDTHKKIIKEKIVKKVKEKPKAVKKRKPKKIVKKITPKKVKKPKDLFSSITTSKKNVKKKATHVSKKSSTVKYEKPLKVSKKPSASDLVSSSLKIQKTSDSGVENAYFARIEEKLKGWPAQSEYAGEMVKVWIKVQPSGFFTFKVIRVSSNEDFNRGLVSYLKQLQSFGFGPHKANRAYELNVEFVAKE